MVSIFGHLLLWLVYAWWWGRWRSFFPDFFLSMYETIMVFFLLRWAKMVDFSSLSFSIFISLGISLRSCRMVPTKVNFWSMPHTASETELKYLSIYILHHSFELDLGTSVTRYFIYSSVPVTENLKESPVLTSGFLAYDSV